MTDDPRFVLAFDTALMGCAAGLYDARSGTCVSRVEPMMRGQSERLVPMVQEVLAQAGQGFSAVDLLAVTVGPGAFTGLRLALSAARAWGLALRRPVAGVTTLAALAAQYYEDDSADAGAAVRILIETKRNDFYTQLFTAPGTAGAAEALSFAVLQERRDPPGTVMIGDAAARYAAACAEKPTVKAGFDMIDPAVVARLALAQYKAGLAAGLVTGMPEPLYLRGADVSESKRAVRTIAAD